MRLRLLVTLTLVTLAAAACTTAPGRTTPTNATVPSGSVLLAGAGGPLVLDVPPGSVVFDTEGAVTSLGGRWLHHLERRLESRRSSRRATARPARSSRRRACPASSTSASSRRAAGRRADGPAARGLGPARSPSSRDDEDRRGGPDGGSGAADVRPRGQLRARGVLLRRRPPLPDPAPARRDAARVPRRRCSISRAARSCRCSVRSRVRRSGCRASASARSSARRRPALHAVLERAARLHACTRRTAGTDASLRSSTS